VIAVDGPAGAGKSTIAALLARRLGVPYLDTGAMYRAVGLLALRAGVTLPMGTAGAALVISLLADHRIDVAAGEEGTRVLVDGEDVSSEIRTPECSAMASAVAALPEVRRELVAVQRRLGDRLGGVIEGRDIGSVVFPDARLKVFLTASVEERARRRHRDLEGTDPTTSLVEVRREQIDRDRRDRSRRDSPLRVAPEALVIDTTGMTPDQVVERLLQALDRSPGGTLDSTDRKAVRSRNDVS
jgi:cytidylate kinase